MLSMLVASADFTDIQHSTVNRLGHFADGSDPWAAAFETADVRDDGGILVSRGSYRIERDITITSPVAFQRLGKLKPAAGVTVTLRGTIHADQLQHIFDLSLGGSVVLAGDAARAPATPHWYGAVADGVTNDRAAIDAVVQSGVAHVWFPAGRYNMGNAIGSRVVVPATIQRLSGLRRSSVLMSQAPNEVGAIFKLTTRIGVIIEDLTFEGSNDVNAPHSALQIHSGCLDITVRGCEAYYFRAGFIRNSNSIETLNERVHYTHNYVHDCQIGAQPSAAGMGALNIESCEHSLLAFNFIKDCGAADGDWGTYCSARTAHSVIANNVYDGAWGGIALSESCSFVDVIGNVVSGHSASAPVVVVTNSGDINVVGNVGGHSRDNAGVPTDEADIRLNSGSDRVNITGNTATSVTLNSGNVEDVSITGNRLTNSDGSCVSVATDNAQRVLIAANEIKCGLAAGYAILNAAAGVFDRIAIKNNMISLTNAGGGAILLRGAATNSEITGNTVIGGDGASIIALDGVGAGCVVSGNHAPGSESITLQNGGTDVRVENNTGRVRLLNPLVGNYVLHNNRNTSDAFVQPFASGDTTPSVLHADRFECAATAGTIVTTLDDGYPGKVVTIVCKNNWTFQDGATLQLAGGGNFVATDNDVLQLYLQGGVWYEVSRSVN
jgi:hypothetical protein